MSEEFYLDLISLSPSWSDAVRMEGNIGSSEMLLLERPSLQLRDLEGRIHKYEGPLSRKIKKAKLKNSRKKRWFRVFPDNHRQHVYHLSQSKSTSNNRTGLQKIIITMHKIMPDICVKVLDCQDPHSKNFTGFTIHDSTNNNAVLETFYADNIVQQRNFMAALGGNGPGLFTQNPDDKLQDDSCVELSTKREADQSKGEFFCRIEGCDLLARQVAYDSQMTPNKMSRVNLPTYESIMQHLPGEFYHLQNERDNRCHDLPGLALPIYDPAQNMTAHSWKTVSDTFLPPHGPAVYHPVNIGSGKEVGLEQQHQALWDTQNNCYYFLDHSTKLTYIDDPRPLNYAITGTSKNEELVYVKHSGLDLSVYEVYRENTAIETAAKRAMRRTHRFIIRGCGRNGSSGIDGKKGKDGLKGSSGTIGVNGDGNNGEDGEVGVKGEDGSSGESGSSGGNVIVEVSGEPSQLKLCINGHHNAVAKLGVGRCEEVVFVDCHGGDGGSGGIGGEGGAGGNGGDGGKGGEGGDGGHGGDGGAGEMGGNGGLGGDAGSEGRCVIRTSNSSLLMLVEIDCRAGAVGKGGLGGNGGRGGRRGFGGEGGIIETPSNTSENHVKIERGLKGKPGSTGGKGSNGRHGSDGTQSGSGGLLWVVDSPLGEIIHQAGLRYDIMVTSLKISPMLCCDGDHYEPNELITVSEVVLTNHGGLPLPRGATLSFPTTKTIRFESTTYEIPEILPKEPFTVPAQFRGRIFDQSTPNSPGPFTGKASLTPRIELLGRPLDTSLMQTLPVSYPVKLSFALSKRNVSKGEESVLEVGVENTSSKVSYGSAENCWGCIRVRMHLDSFLVPLGVMPICSDDIKHLNFQVSYDPHLSDSLWVDIKELHPLEVVTFAIAFKIDDEAKPCDTCVWQSDLYYKGKLIEYMAQEIRVTPSYSLPSSPTNLGDVLMITSKHISGTEFKLWQKIFDILSLNVDYWDLNYTEEPDMLQSETDSENSQDSLTSPGQEASSTAPSTPKPSNTSNIVSGLPSFYKMYRGKTILYPYCNLDDFSVEDIVSCLDSPSSEDSSVLLYLSTTVPKSLEDSYYDHIQHAQILRHLCRIQDRIKMSEDIHTGYHLVAPGTFMSPEVSVKKSEKRSMKRVEKDCPSHTVAMFSHGSGISQRSPVKYSYGSIDVRRCPIKRSSNFQCVSGVGGSMTSMGSDDPLLTVKSREFPLASKFGQVLLSVLASAPLKSKLRILKSSKENQCQGFVKCYLPNGTFLTKQELAAIAIAHDVADEILDCSISISRMKLVVEDIQSNRTFYSRNGVAPVINQMLSLIEEEAKERVARCESSSAAQSATREVCKFCLSLRILDISNLVEGSHGYRNQHTKGHHTSRMNSLPAAPHSSRDAQTARTQSCSNIPTNSRTHHTRFNNFHSAGMSKTLPPLRILQDSLSVLRSHQLMVEDCYYDVSKPPTLS